jgi:hypothetical protein
LSTHLHLGLPSGRGNVFTESLPSNVLLFWLPYSGFGASCHSIEVCNVPDWNQLHLKVKGKQ